MIDFRYHLVSLVSVFLALAIGVVLGAGPLRGTLGDTLTAQMQSLREDKVNLQQAVNNRDQDIATQNSALAKLGDPLVADTLSGRTVLQVVLPGADPASVASYGDLVEAAGAQLAPTVTINSGWTDPAAASTRAQALTELDPAMTSLGVTPTATPTGTATTATPDRSDSGTLAQLLAVAATQSSPGAGGSGEDRTILEQLSGSQLISMSASSLVPADLVVVFAPGPTTGAAGSDAEWQQIEIADYQDLVTAFKAESGGVVVNGPVSSANTTGLLSQLRNASTNVSTVDGNNATAGLGVVLALIQQSEGGSGHYGSGSGATAVLPPMPPGNGSGSGSGGTTSPTTEPTTATTP